MDDAGLPVFPERFNLADYLLAHNLEGSRGARTAVLCGQERYTYAQVDSLARRAAGALRGLGAGMEDRVLIVLPDGIEFVAAWLGTLKAGAVFAMANTIHTAEDYLYYLDYTRAPVAVVHASVLDRFEAILPRARHLQALLVAGGPPGRHPSFEAELARAPDRFETAETSADDIAGWLFTSGSTGKPKAAVHFHQDFAYSIETYARQVLAMRPGDVTVSVPKLFFGYATGTNLMFPFAAGGATALFPERSTPEAVFEMIARHRPTVLTSVPTMINGMLQAAEGSSAPPDLSCLRVCLSAGEALPAELYRRWKKTFGVEVLDGIGSAEMFHIYISNRFGDVREESLGRLVPGYEARVVGPGGEDLPDGEQGTLWVKGGSTALCYWQRRASSRATFRGDWCVTGDQFRRDQEGYFYYCGRTDDMLKVGGIFVSPLEIEDCLLGHDAVREAAVVGEADDGGLTKPKAYVALKEGRSPSRELAFQLKTHVKGRLAPYKYPRWIAFVQDLPRSDRGKVLRAALRDGGRALLTVAVASSGADEEGGSDAR
ncbi:MAG TPA: benzoate-CoA ligase family protein [Candidatus Polarisedimenticolia bacterium]|nr:benzoate-CoA ligase family protein [Candidatus Polarisedimenticolia bacterium]